MIITAIKLNESSIASANGTIFDVKCIIDAYISVIWADRYNEAGDFELVLPAVDKYILALKEDDLLISNESDTIMVIDSIELKQEETETHLYLRGLSIESWLNRRVVYEKTYFYGQNSAVYPDPTNDPAMVVNALSYLMQNAFIGQANSSNKRATNTIHTNVLVEGSLTQDHPFLSMFVEAYIYNQNLYDTIVYICQQLEIGFKFKYTITGNRIYFNLCLYYGLVLTDNMTPSTPYYNPNLKVVIFSEKYNNLLTSDYNIDKTTYKNSIKVDGTYHETDPDDPDNLIDVPIFITVDGQIKQDDGTYIDPYGLYRREEYNDSTSVSDQGEYSCTVGDITNIDPTKVIINTAFADAQGLLDLTHAGLNTKFYVNKTSYDGSTRWSLSQTGPWVLFNLSDYHIFIEVDPGTSYAIFSFSLLISYANNGSQATIIPQADYEKRLENEGKGVLIDREYLEEFTAEIVPEINFTYGTDPSDDYYLGDVVTVRNKYGMAAYCRITEYIHAEDDSGKSDHPTFTIVDSNIGTET